VQRSATELVELLGLADHLAAEAEAHGGRFVVTHGEPHAGNVMRTREGRVLVDWDTVSLAPPERDLWMLVGEDTAAADLYARATGTPLDPGALDYFRLTWDLKDLAEYLKLLRSPHQENEDTRRACWALENSAAIRDEWGLRELELPGAVAVVEAVRGHRLPLGLHPVGVELLAVVVHRRLHLRGRRDAPRLAASVDLAFQLYGCHLSTVAVALPPRYIAL
jgi:Predicted choline kinase involved in LPS biosynthesis